MDSRNTDAWTDKKRERVVNVFAWLLKEDKKQNPDLYKKATLEKGQSESEPNSQKALRDNEIIWFHHDSAHHV